MLIGILVAGIGYAFNVLIEQYKAKETFYLELNKTRVAKIAETWDKVYIVDYQITKMMNSLGREANLKKQLAFQEAHLDIKQPAKGQDFYDQESKKIDQEMIERLYDEKEKLVEGLSEVVQKNRFWLDQTSYSALHEYVLAVDSITKVREFGLGEESEKSRKELSDRLEALRGNIAHIQNDIFLHR